RAPTATMTPSSIRRTPSSIVRPVAVRIVPPASAITGDSIGASVSRSILQGSGGGAGSGSRAAVAVMGAPPHELKRSARDSDGIDVRAATWAGMAAPSIARGRAAVLRAWQAPCAMQAPEDGTIERWAWDYVLATSLADKLAPARRPDRWEAS